MPRDLQIIPKTIPEARAALHAMLADLTKAKTYAELCKIERMAKTIKTMFKEVDEVRLDAGEVIVLSLHRMGRELLNQPMNKGERGQYGGRNIGVTPTPTLKELVGNAMRGSRLRKFGQYDVDTEVKPVIAMIRQKLDDITFGGVIKKIGGAETIARRRRSRSTMPLLDGMELRIGDCRKVLADVADNSIPLVLTDPPYGDKAEQLYHWLAEWSKRVLIPGGSLICYTGQSRLDRDIRIFGEHLRYWWLLAMQHTQKPQRLPGKFVLAGFKPVLWYVKDFRRGKTLLMDVLDESKRDKSLHDWGQGEAGVTNLIEVLTEPGEQIVDPFAGTALWGRIAAQMGRKWLGADIVKGGEKKIFKD